jgi:hypothetical protein
LHEFLLSLISRTTGVSAIHRTLDPFVILMTANHNATAVRMIGANTSPAPFMTILRAMPVPVLGVHAYVDL